MSSLDSSSPRGRLLDTARRLFLRDGIPATGINTITDQADVARMTLYNAFGSKEDLVVAVFEREADLRRAAITTTQNELETPTEKVLAIFSVALELADLKGFRGCAFINLAIEAAAPDSALHDLARQHKDWIRDNIRTHLSGACSAEADRLAQQISVLWDGGIVGAYVHQSSAPIRTARDAAAALIRAALP